MTNQTPEPLKWEDLPPEPELIPVEPTPEIGPQPGKDFDFPDPGEKEYEKPSKPWNFPNTWKN